MVSWGAAWGLLVGERGGKGRRVLRGKCVRPIQRGRKIVVRAVD